ncbi:MULTISPECIES: hypothetical protein [Bacillus amyloliquefaciens group]|uniref:hypothetical protein n=1 Tax=Bacillus amyloliquefaciens group TaxID=1938374 RepID=UPI00073C2ED0|nr:MULTISPECIES: hypothetical protein [Bacillus amyloliquefaciens group]KTF59111.1 hypothetical protein AR691_17665 [Bacillus amyloliquefaciens]
MGFFNNPRKMFIPLSIDNAESERLNYFFSNKKMVGMTFALIPYFILLYPLLQGGVKVLALIIVTVVYAVLYFYFIRFWVLEEKRLRRMVRELDDNRVSGVSHFWGIDKIGGGNRDNGVIYYQRDGSRLKRGLVVYFDRGSTVGVPKGHYDQFRKTKMEFMRELGKRGMNFQWYEIQKRAEMPQSLIHYANILNEEDNDIARKLLKLQLNINMVYTMDAEQRYVDYIVITNKRFVVMKRFKEVIQDLVTTKLGGNSYIVDPKILNKEEVEEFFQNVLMIDSLDSDFIRKSVEVQPFENFARLHQVIDKDGKSVPLELLDDIDLNSPKYRGRSLEDALSWEEKREEAKDRERIKKMEYELEKARIKRNRDQITAKEYEELKEEIEKKFDPEVYDLDADKKERDRIRGEKRKERGRGRVKDQEHNNLVEEPEDKGYRVIKVVDVKQEITETESTVDLDVSLEDLVKNESENYGESDQGSRSLEELLRDSNRG